MKSQKISIQKLILFEDDNYLVISKPVGISTLEDRNSNINILSLARERYEGASVCHRLDKETSGVLAIAKNEVAYRHLNMQFEKRTVNKIYHAVVDSIEQFEYIMISAPIRQLKVGGVRIDKQEGKEAHTIVNTLKCFTAHSLVECNLLTGRMHQIRVHLSYINAPITGDEQYGGKPFFLSSYKKKYNLKQGEEELPVMSRVALHAFSLKFEGLNGEAVEVHAPYPKDFTVMLKQMEKFSL